MKTPTGNYEDELTDNEKLIPLDTTAKRLAAAMQMGVRIRCEDGHRWIDANESGAYDTLSLNELLAQNNLPPISSKVYGNLFDALNRIDGALKVLKRGTLVEQFSLDVWGF